MMDYPLTLSAILERAGKYFGDTEIVSRRPDRSLHRYKFSDFYQRARRLAECLSTAGLQRGDRVATLMWNHSVHFEAYFGITAAGGVLHPLNLRLHPDEIAYIVNHAQDRFLIVDEALLPVLEKIKSKIQLERIFVVHHGPQAQASPYEDYEQWLQQASGHFELPRLNENDGASMCFTSGTTGNPKGVLLIGSSMFHVNAWGFPYTAAMVGAKLVFPGSQLDATSLLELMGQENVTVTCAVPTVWLAMLALLDQRGPNWKLPQDVRILCGGTAPPESLIRGLDRHGFHLIQSWGMTETSPMATVSRLRPSMSTWQEEKQYEVRSRQGWPLPFVDVRITTPDGEAPCDGQTPGEVEVRGPWVAASYYKAPGSKDRWTADGWFRTGDVATMDAEGCIKIVDRSKDLIKSGGEWISSADLENALMSHPSVREAAVIAAPHPKWQERPLAIVQLNSGASATPEELRAFLGTKFAKWQLPDDFVFVTELPHTSTGKLLKMELRKQYANWEWSGQ